ncbi:MAG: hypothetical protein PHU06_06350 [Gallionella sp.]|nr:hypothetical protein [Gallionella sp.]MDD4958132.1 hypothetical protein [Gallionella sp.]
MKIATEMVSEILEHLELNSNAVLYAISVVINSRNEVESMVWEKPVGEVFFDHEDKELILFVPLTDADGALPISCSSFLIPLLIHKLINKCRPNPWPRNN